MYVSRICTKKISSLIIQIWKNFRFVFESAAKQMDDFESAQVKRGRKDALEIVH